MYGMAQARLDRLFGPHNAHAAVYKTVLRALDSSDRYLYGPHIVLQQPF